MNKQRQRQTYGNAKSMRADPRKSGIARLQTNNNMQAIGCVFTNIYIYIYISAGPLGPPGCEGYP